MFLMNSMLIDLKVKKKRFVKIKLFYSFILIYISSSTFLKCIYYFI